MSATKLFDTAENLCQSASITDATPLSMGSAPCLAHGGALVKTSRSPGWGGPRPGFGGPQPGSGRPRKPNPIAPTQISYATDDIRWYCVRTDYGAETTVDVAIREAGFETLFPLQWVPPIPARRTADGRAIPARSERLVPLLPRYLIVRFNRADPSWRHICTMRGVERLFSTHPEVPTPIPDRDITLLRQDLAPNGVLYPLVIPALAAKAKRRWVDMATALVSLLDPNT